MNGFPNDPKYVAEQIKDIVDVMLSKMSLEGRQKAYPNLKGKIHQMNHVEISSKKNHGGAPIGASITLIKNILNGKDPYFVKSVLDELRMIL